VWEILQILIALLAFNIGYNIFYFLLPHPLPLSGGEGGRIALIAFILKSTFKTKIIYDAIRTNTILATALPLLRRGLG
jgi:hypothetical protein